MNSTIGVVTIGQEPGFYNGRYFREIITATSHTAVARHVNVRIVGLTHQQAESAVTTSALLEAEAIGALLIVAPSEPILPLLKTMFQQLPGIIVSPPTLSLSLSYVASDNYGALQLAVQHLAMIGRRRILHVTPSPLTGDYWERSRGYRDAVIAHGFESLHRAISSALPDTIVNDLVPQLNPDAMIVPSDNDAREIIKRLSRKGKRVPHDIAMIGFDDEDFASEMSPSLTTFAQPVADMATSAVTYLIDRMQGVNRGLFQQIQPNRLIVRESTGG